MANFPTTTSELEQYISDYMDAHIAEHLQDIADEQIVQAVSDYMQSYGAAIEDNGANGEVPLVADNALDADNMTIPLARLSNGVPTSFFQARVRALAIAAAHLITHADIPMQVVNQTETEVEINPNVLNVWGSVDSLDVTLVGAVSGGVNEYMLQFDIASNVASFELALSAAVEWVDGEEPEWEAGNTYQVSIVNNMAVAAWWTTPEGSDSSEGSSE